ncbi:hypothetical protein [Streptomyces sp. NPDC056632]|uniref:hypothetical protein n=1 Tax=Streptomyces sp. NPDC056632 TaxID=3345884 RepID=UPI00367DFBDF
MGADFGYEHPPGVEGVADQDPGGEVLAHLGAADGGGGGGLRDQEDVEADLAAHEEDLGERVDGLLNEQHYGDATYMTMREMVRQLPRRGVRGRPPAPRPPAPERKCSRRHGHVYGVEVAFTAPALQGCLDA